MLEINVLLIMKTTGPVPQFIVEKARRDSIFPQSLVKGEESAIDALRAVSEFLHSYSVLQMKKLAVKEEEYTSQRFVRSDLEVMTIPEQTGEVLGLMSQGRTVDFVAEEKAFSLIAYEVGEAIMKGWVTSKGLTNKVLRNYYLIEVDDGYVVNKKWTSITAIEDSHGEDQGLQVLKKEYKKIF